MNRSFDIFGTVLLGVGFFLAFLPHATHTAVGLGEETHLTHITIGMILVASGLGILVYNNKALKIWNKSKF